VVLLSFALNVSALAMDEASSDVKSNGQPLSARMHPLTINSSIDDLLKHPA
jgi:hypothetical protein